MIPSPLNKVRAILATDDRNVWIVSLIVMFVGVDGLILVCALAYNLVTGQKSDSVIHTSVVTLAGTLVGYLGGMLTSLRTSQASPPPLAALDEPLSTTPPALAGAVPASLNSASSASSV